MMKFLLLLLIFQFRVDTIIGDRITDPDNGAVEGIAITDASTGWQYSLNDGTSWLPLTTPLLLSDQNLLKNNIPLTVGGRAPWLKWRAWDQTQGTVGLPYTILETGGETAFSENEIIQVFVAADGTVDEDKQLPVTYKTLSVKRNPATVSNATYTITPAAMGTWINRKPTDPINVAGHFKPSGITGTCELKIEATNRNGNVITGTATIEVIAGPAVIIEIEFLPQVDQE